MGIGRRIADLYEVKVNALLDRAEDPRQMLDYSYAQQQELLFRLRRAVTDVAAARKRAGMQEDQLRLSAGRLQSQARQAVAAGGEELARQALALRTAALAHADDLAAEQAVLRVDEERLTAAARRLRVKTEAFRVRKETLKAGYIAAQALAGADQVFGGISEEMGDVGLATRRAEDTTARLRARASAIDELLASGALADVTGLAGEEEEIKAQLDAVTARAAVEEELAVIKDQLESEAGQRPGEPAPPAPRPRQSFTGPQPRGRDGS